MDRWKGGGRGALAFLVVFIPCTVLSLSFYKEVETNIAERRDSRYTAMSNNRHARLVNGMTGRKQILNALVAFFNASKHVSADEFRVLSEKMLGASGVVAMCWTASEGDTRLVNALDTSRAEELCNHFDLLEPSQIVGRSQPLIIFSMFASTSEGSQKGFASIIFEASSLFLEPVPGLAEYLVIHDSIQNAATTYIFSDVGVLGAKAVNLPKDSMYFELAKFGAVSFLYLTEHLPEESSHIDPRLILTVLLGLGLLASLYVRSLVLAKARISHEVALRTDELSQFAYRTSHDLRGPLVTVGGLCRAMCEDIEDGVLDDLADNATRIEAQVNRLDRLVGDILMLTEADLSEQESEKIDFACLLDEIIAHVGTTFEGHGVRVDVDVSVKESYHLPKARIFQILENLISNSVKYANPKVDDPFVKVMVSRKRGGVEVVVRDNGLGIPQEFHGRLFKMFERFHPEASTIGSGLGLSIVKKHVDRLGGDIDLVSDDEGTVITLTLPAMKALVGGTFSKEDKM